MQQRCTVIVAPTHRPAAADDAAGHESPADDDDRPVLRDPEGRLAHAIADKFGVDLAQLIALNKIKDPNKIQAGQKLRLPPITVLLNRSTTLAPATTAHP